QVRLLDLFDVNDDLFAGTGFEGAAQIVDLSTLAADNNTRPGSVDGDLATGGRTLNVNARNTCVIEPSLDVFTKREVLVEIFLVGLLIEIPTAFPLLDYAKAKRYRMYFLSHLISRSL